MSHDVVDQVKARKNFYRDNYRASLKILMYCLLLIIGLIIAIALLTFFKPEPTYYASSVERKLTQIYPARWGTRIVQPRNA